MSAPTARPARLLAVKRSAAIANRIVTVRGVRVVIDNDLAELYGVTTRALNQAVARNSARFPSDFAFRLTAREVANLRSQSVTSSVHGGQRYAPRAFTEHGVAMLSSVLKSRRAISVNLAIMRAFVNLREMALTHLELSRKLADLERKYDGKFVTVFDAIRRLVAEPLEIDEPRRRVGFITDRLPGSRAKAHT